MPETKRFFSSLGLLMVLNMLIKPVWIFGIERQVQNIAGAEAYGSYFSLLSLSVVFSFLTDWGFNSFINRQLAAASQSLIAQIGNLVVIKLFFTLIYVVTVLAVAFITGVRQWNHLFMILLIQVATSFFLFFRSIITAHQWFTAEACLSVLDKALMILICGTLIYLPFFSGTITINQFLFFQAMSVIIAMFCALGILLIRGIRFLPDKPVNNSRKILRKAAPFAVIILLMYAHYRLDGFLLERLHPDGAYEAGIYAAAWRILDAANMPGYLVASLLLPFLAGINTTKQAGSATVLYSRHTLLVYAVFVIVTFFFFAPWWQQLLYHTADKYPVKVLQLCVPVLAALSLIHVYGTVLTAAGHLRSFCIIVALSLLTNILFNFFLIPSFGAKGCCIAALISQGACAIMLLLSANKKEKQPIHARSLCIYFFSGTVLCGFFYALQNLSLSPLLIIATGGAVTLLIITATGLIPVKQWRNLINKTTDA